MMGHGLFGFFGPFIMFAPLAVIIAAGVLLVKAAYDSEKVRVGIDESAMEILKRRYARGEITAQEYGRARATLSGDENEEERNG